MSKKNSGANEPQNVPQDEAVQLTESNQDEPKPDETKADEPKADEPKADEPKADEPKPDEPKPDEPKADEPKADEPKSDDENEATAISIMKSHSKKEVWLSGDGYWFSVKDLAEFHASNKQTTLKRYSDDTAKG